MRVSILSCVLAIWFTCQACEESTVNPINGPGTEGSAGSSGEGGEGGSGEGGTGGGASGGEGGITVLPDGGIVGPDGAAIDPGTGPLSLDECPGDLDDATVSALTGGGPVDPAMRWLYPYNGTMFPNGILPPVLQWDPQAGGTDGFLLVIRSAEFDYRGCFGPADPARLPLPTHVWESAYSKSQGPSDVVTVELTTIHSGVVSGPIVQTWTFALGSLKGTVYYNTYDSPKASHNGAVMRINPGAAEPEVLVTAAGVQPFGPCVSCHSVSADGGKMVASFHLYPGTYSSMSYDLQANPGLNPPPLTDPLDEAGFAGMYPDGSRFMTIGTPTDSTTGGQPFFPYGAGNVYAMVGPRVSRLFDTFTGQQIPAPGWDGVIQYAKMPMFSPDGKKIVFNHHEDSGGHTLAVMDFDPDTNTFSNLDTIYEDTNGLYPGWPMFTPDGKQVAFVLGNDEHFASCELDPIGNTVGIFNSELFIVDLATETTVRLDLAGGIDGGSPYLPQGPRDERLDFYPTMAPISSGGYFWLYFTSRRTYGNITSHMPVLDRNTKKIWVSALTIEPEPGVDPSHPAFILPGQEIDAGNMRAFPTLEPCKEDGEPCVRGIDCCSGYCNDGICGPREDPCAELDEACETDEDCCDSTHKCIGGYCAIIVLE
jgi:hypothetical protein